MDSEAQKNTSKNGTALLALTRKGAALAARINAELPESVCFCNSRYALPGMNGFRKLSDVFASVWRSFDSIICIMSTGIAVRISAPLISDKMIDPAVVVLDQDGRFAISLLSGHIGGANALARKVAGITGGQPVITTASDIQDKPAIDLAAISAGLKIENRRMLSRIEATILDEERLWIFDPGGILLKHLPVDHGFEVLDAASDSVSTAGKGRTEAAAGEYLENVPSGLGIWVSEFIEPAGSKCLRLRPQNLVVGIGCNRGTTSGEIIDFIERTLSENRISPLSIRNFASVDIKSDERGLLDAALYFKRQVIFCTREEIADIPVPNPSETVDRHIGAKSVCEASALWSAGSRQLLIPKLKSGNCTLAIARVSCP
jgi:cobalt-precorrin 5A hydrolase